MFRSNLKSAYRNILKNKYISLLNVVGLSVGLTCTIILLSWVAHELSFDRFFNNCKNIYRINFNGEMNEEYVRVCSSPQGVGPEAKNQFAEVENFTRIRVQPRSAFKVGENYFYLNKGFSADSTFFSVFSYEAKMGDLSKALNKKDQIVIDEYLAEKCFAQENPIGKTINISNHNYSVSAVLKNIPGNSHLSFHYLIPTLNLPDGWHRNKWGSDNCTQYLVLADKVNISDLEDKLNQMLYQYNDLWEEVGVNLSMQSLSDIHFSSGYTLENAVKGNKQSVFILASVALLILLIACVNFTNMFISTSLKRARSTGVKIVSGASKGLIVREFFIEVLLFILIAFILGIALVKLILPLFNTLIDTQIKIQVFSLKFLVISLSLIIITILLSGLFPGLYLARNKPAISLKAGNSGFSGKNNNFQSGLVTLQFVIAIILIISVLVIQKQVHYFKNKKLGFEKENLVYVYTQGEFNDLQKLHALKNKLLKKPEIKGISFRSCLLTDMQNGGFMSPPEDLEFRVHGEMIYVGEDYFDVMGIEFIEGSQDFNYANQNIQNCVINESAAKQLGLERPYLGQMVYNYNESDNLLIRGVIKDINIKSLDQKVKPALYTKANEYYDTGIILFRLEGNYEQAIDDIKTYYIENNSSVPFEYHFLDQTYDNLYKNEARTQKILSLFSVLSVLLTSLGLLAMSYFITENRTKEIGVRKVNGAKIIEVMSMLNREFILWVVLAFILSSPIAWYAMHKWLETFAYKITLNWWIFAFAGVIAFSIALLTVSWQSWKVARRNPVEALRYE